jgi:vancomycin resistance protein YoaR
MKARRFFTYVGRSPSRGVRGQVGGRLDGPHFFGSFFCCGDKKGTPVWQDEPKAMMMQRKDHLQIPCDPSSILRVTEKLKSLLGIPPTLRHNARMLLRKYSIVGILGLFGIFGIFPIHANAASLNLTYRNKHFLYTINTAKQINWTRSQEIWTYNNQPVIPPANLRVDGDTVPPLPDGFRKSTQTDYDRAAIMQTLQSAISSTFDRPAGKVSISRSATGVILFDGVGFPGRTIDLEAAADMTIVALKSGISDITLPVTETQPSVVVTDPQLQAQGVKELVTIGESDFSNSPVNRRLNIAVGLAKFQGHVIPKDSIFSFDETLGPVDGTTGYVKELVIKGDQTVPDYGGGLCQVSSTAYRGIWEYGFPITQRRNHSYMVGHYAPQGTDATVYPPSADMKFKNDSPGALLIQTYAADDKAYFLYYGTKDDRKADVLGPFIWDQTLPPADKTQLTLDLKPGEKKKVGERVPGERVAWFRTVQKDGTSVTQGTYSIYEARPLFYLMGTDKLPTVGSGATVPSVFLDE